MVKNITGGSKHKKYAKKSSDITQYNIKNLIKEGNEQMYAYVDTILGNCRFNVKCTDDKIRLAHIRGKLRKRSWCKVGDIILISLRDFQDNKCDIIKKYNPEEVAVLIQHNEISKCFGKTDKFFIYDYDSSQKQNNKIENQSVLFSDNQVNYLNSECFSNSSSSSTSSSSSSSNSNSDLNLENI